MSYSLSFIVQFHVHKRALIFSVVMFLFRVIDSCQEAFILRLYRQKNKVF